MKQVIRSVIMRQYDYDRLCKYWDIGHPHGLYHESTFVPLTRTALEQDYIIKILSAGPAAGSEHWIDPDRNWVDPDRTSSWSMFRILYSEQLYDRRYLSWTIDQDSQGGIWCQARSNTPRSLLGQATFIYKPMSRSDLDLRSRSWP